RIPGCRSGGSWSRAGGRWSPRPYPSAALTSQITHDAPPEAGQDLSEAGHAVEFVGVTGLAPARVIAMLLATPGVPPGCLQVAARAGRDPDVIPRGRNRKRPNPVQGGEVPDALAVGSDVLKLLA